MRLTLGTWMGQDLESNAMSELNEHAIINFIHLLKKYSALNQEKMEPN